MLPIETNDQHDGCNQAILPSVTEWITLGESL